MASLPNDAQQVNQDHLLAHLEAIKTYLSGHARSGADAVARPPSAPAVLAEVSAELARLTDAFGLSAFERDTLLLCAGMELDGDVPALCAAAQGDQLRPYPTFSLVLAALPDAHWSALAPESPLRYWRLIEVGPGRLLTRAALRVDERVLHFLSGIRQLDERLAVLLEPLVPCALDTLVASQAAVAEQVADVWSGAARGRELAVVQLCGAAADCRPIAAAAAKLLGLRAAVLPAERLPPAAADLDTLLRLWEREAVLSSLGVLVLDSDDAVAADSDAGRSRSAAISRLLERAAGPVLLREREPRRLASRQSTVLEVAHPQTAEQLTLWRDSLGDLAPQARDLEIAASQFSLTLPAIKALAAEVRARANASPPTDLGEMVWDLARRRLRSALDGLAQRIESDLHWDDLVLPPLQKQTLHALAAQLRQRTMVHDRWGFAEKSRRGLGISALFHGPSGTGKTMAAEVLASELRLD